MVWYIVKLKLKLNKKCEIRLIIPGSSGDVIIIYIIIVLFGLSQQK